MSEKLPIKSVHVMLVEDNPGDVLLVKESFRELNIPYRLTVAKDGQEAIDMLYGMGRHSLVAAPDLILLDLNLPKVSGHDVLAHVKGSLEFQHIPVVILSTSASPVDIQKAYALAANCYVCKPNGLDEFFHLMRTLQEFWLKLARLSTADGPALAPCPS